MKKDVSITLKKEGADDIVVTCPPKIKLGYFSAFAAVSHGLPPANIKPKQKKDILKAFLLFILIYASLILCAINIALGAAVCLIFLIINISFNRNYFFKFIRTKIAEGYSVEDEEHKKLLEAAGVFGTPEKSNANGSKPKVSVFAKLNALISRLPFNGLTAKIPVVQKFSKYANYAFCILVVVVLALIFGSKDPVDSYISDLQKARNSMEKSIEKYYDGKISIEELTEKFTTLTKEIYESTDSMDVNTSASSKQEQKIRQLMSEIDVLANEYSKLRLQYNYGY